MMEKVYVSLILKDKKTFNQVPDELKEKVKNILIEMNREDLIK